jgi:DNA-binding transcriptional ArsR family regulator/uncharacterized protein YndB with AHSA1/START domain
METIFRALSDSTRRYILDELRAKDGQSLSELESKLEMSRFGVMKHLKVLENANLVVTRKVGRHKYHYLNPVPIQEIAERWIASYAQPWVASMTHLKNTLERSNPTMTATAVKPKHVYTTIIQTTPEKLWQALTSGEISPHYYYGFSLKSDLKPGASFDYLAPTGDLIVSGTILEIEPMKRLVTSFKGHWDPSMAGDPETRVTYEIEVQGECCKLTLIHDEFEAETATYTIVGGGWPGILSGLKTLLETGKPLNYSPMG